MAKSKKKAKAKARPKSKAKGAKPKAKGPSLLFAIAQTTLPIVGSDQVFPVRRIYCIGRNYAAHAREMGSDPTREPPFFFQKPTDAIQIAPAGVTIDHPYKSFDHSAVLGSLQPLAKTGHFTQGAIWLKVNGQVKQNADL